MSTPNNPFYELSPEIKSLLAIETFRVSSILSALWRRLTTVSFIGKRLYNRFYREDIEWCYRTNE